MKREKQKVIEYDSNNELGEVGEQIAEKKLLQLGMKILVRRYRCRFGEVDLVMRDKNILVFIEVKSRRSWSFGDPSEAVNEHKQKHISRVALDYVRRLKYPRVPMRFDIVEVVFLKEGWNVNHYLNAFPLSDPYIY